jgi:hypothetical protein
VNLVVEVDRDPGYDFRSGDWSDTRRFLIPEGGLKFEYPPADQMRAEIEAEIDEALPFLSDEDQAFFEDYRAWLPEADELSLQLEYNTWDLGEKFEVPALARLGETNTGDPTNFRNFLNWSIQNYPAEKYGVILWNHGGGWTGIGPDDGSFPGILSPQEIDQVLGEVRERNGIDKFDFIGFDACLMSQLEVMAYVTEHANYAIAAQEVVPNSGYDYEAWLQILADEPSLEAQQLGEAIVDTFGLFYENVQFDPTVDVHLIDLSEIPDVVAAVDAFGALAQADPPAILTQIGLARNSTRIFGAQDPVSAEYFSAVDLVHLMNLFAATDAAPELREAAQTVIDQIGESVAYSYLGFNSLNANGLAIYFPFSSQAFDFGENERLYPALVEDYLPNWLGFFNSFHETANATLSPDTLSIDVYEGITLSEEVSMDFPPTFLFYMAGQGLVSMNFQAAVNFDGTEVVVAQFPLVFTEFDSAGNVVNYFPSEVESYYTWDAKIPVIWQDEVAIPVLLFNSTDNSRATVTGTYQWADGTQENANLIFDTWSFELMSAWSVITTPEGSVTSQISISPNDIFYPDLYVLEGDEMIPTITEDLWISMANERIAYEYIPAYSGAYRFRLEIRDLAGNTSLDEWQLVVNNDAMDGSTRGFVQLYEGVLFSFPAFWADATYQGLEDDSYRYIIESPDLLEHIIFEPFYSTTELDPLLEQGRAYLADYTDNIGEPIELTISDFPAYILPYEYTEEATGTYYYGHLLLTCSDYQDNPCYWIDIYADTPEKLQALSDTIVGSMFIYPWIDISRENYE